MFANPSASCQLHGAEASGEPELPSTFSSLEIFVFAEAPCWGWAPRPWRKTHPPELPLRRPSRNPPWGFGRVPTNPRGGGGVRLEASWQKRYKKHKSLEKGRSKGAVSWDDLKPVLVKQWQNKITCDNYHACICLSIMFWMSPHLHIGSSMFQCQV